MLKLTWIESDDGIGIDLKKMFIFNLLKKKQLTVNFKFRILRNVRGKTKTRYGNEGRGGFNLIFFLTFEGLILLGTECSLGTKVFTLTREGADPMAPYPCGGGNDS